MDAVEDVVGQMGIDRGLDLGFAGLDVGHELQQPSPVIALGEPFAVHEIAFHQHRVRIQESVGGDEIDFRMVGPTTEQRLQHASSRGLADGDRAGDTDDEGHLGRQLTEEGVRCPVQLL